VEPAILPKTGTPNLLQIMVSFKKAPKVTKKQGEQQELKV
jgi:hypothetical protein